MGPRPDDGRERNAVDPHLAVGTRRMLGIVNPGHPDVDPGEMPDRVLRLLTPEHDFTIWGDFYICPVAPERAGWMRFVVVKRARRLVAGRE
jgi:hypothetical protein